ncbi:MAG: sigma 54-interacting transcriptional regulator, partial [Myxococcales bacterium]|nr:sigma 54-interacting transcriptional regulator [Myxococcales bacterium]
LIDAELFGNARNYPNPGMRERPGLVGAAAGGTLFLDELGELSHELQAHLLRVLDHGEYQRLGESETRRAELRFVGATNRAPAELKHDLLARLLIRVELPGLERRREDIPLLVVHLLRQIAAGDPGVAARFFTDRDPQGWPRLRAAVISELLTRPYATHVRELQERLYACMLVSAGDTIELAPAGDALDDDAPGDGDVDPASLSAAQIRACLEEHGGSQAKTWRALGLRSRYQLARLLRKHAITP